MTHASADDRYRTAGPLRVLVAVHGYESAGWMAAACRVVSTWRHPRVRLLAILDVPCPPFTSLTPSARRLYGAARAAWAEREDLRIQGVVERILPGLPGGVEVVRVSSSYGDIARTIVEHGTDWPAEVVVVGAPAPGVRWWLWPGPVHEQVLRRMTCAVLVTPPPEAARRRRMRLVAAGRAIWPGPRPAVTGEGA